MQRFLHYEYFVFTEGKFLVCLWGVRPFRPSSGFLQRARMRQREKPTRVKTGQWLGTRTRPNPDAAGNPRAPSDPEQPRGAGLKERKLARGSEVPEDPTERSDEEKRERERGKNTHMLSLGSQSTRKPGATHHDAALRHRHLEPAVTCNGPCRNDQEIRRDSPR
jgi:hypothetical protein